MPAVAKIKNTPKSSPDIIDGVRYPSSDGKPMAETHFHVLAMIELFGLVRKYYLPRSDVYVACNMFWYYERGNPKAVTSPDLMVNFGVSHNGPRRSFMTWNENGVIPTVAFEMASENTFRKHLKKTKELYESLGVQEYFLFDPEDRYLDYQLMGFQLQGGKYRPLIPTSQDGSLFSKGLNMRLIPKGRHLRPADPETGILLPTEEEQRHRAHEIAFEAKRLEDEQRVRANEQHQRANEQQERAEVERQRAEVERQRAEEERQRAEVERQRADSLQEELNRLRQQLHARQNGSNGSHPEPSP